MAINPFAELPLAVLTTLMPLAAGAFLGMLVIALTDKPDERLSNRLGKAALLPIALMACGFVGAFFHLHDPLHAPFAIVHVGSSPLTNEILVACAFAVVSVVYWLAGRTGKLSAGSHRVWLAVLAVGGALLAVFTGLAYHVSTIPAWATPLVPIEMVGYYLVAAPLGAAAVRLAGGTPSKRASRAVLAVAACGVAVALVATVAHAAFVGSLNGAYLAGSELIAAAIPYSIAALALTAVYVAALAASLSKERLGVASLAFQIALPIAAVFCARLAFYCLRMSVGI